MTLCKNAALGRGTHVTRSCRTRRVLETGCADYAFKEFGKIAMATLNYEQKPAHTMCLMGWRPSKEELPSLMPANFRHLVTASSCAIILCSLVLLLERAQRKRVSKKRAACKAAGKAFMQGARRCTVRFGLHYETRPASILDWPHPHPKPRPYRKPRPCAIPTEWQPISPHGLILKSLNP